MSKKRKQIKFEDVQTAEFWNENGTLTMFFKGHEIVEPPEPELPPDIPTGIKLELIVTLPEIPTNLKTLYYANS